MATKKPRQGLFGKLTGSALLNAVRNPGLAASNVASRFGELGGGTTSALNRIRYAITPQTAAAQMRQEGEQYLNQQFPEGYEFSLEGRPQSLVSGVSQIAPQQIPQQVVEENALLDLINGIGGGGLTSTAPIFQQYLDGMLYSDPAAYFNAIADAAQREYEQATTRAREDVGRSRSSLLRQVEEALGELGRSRTRGLEDIGSYYSGLGDIYQSSQGVRSSQFEDEIAREQGRTERTRDETLADIDRSLEDYLAQAEQARVGALDKTFQSAADIRREFQNVPQVRTFNPEIGNFQLQDTSALMRNLNQFLQPENLRRRTGATQSTSPVFNYLNP